MMEGSPDSPAAPDGPPPQGVSAPPFPAPPPRLQGRLLAGGNTLLRTAGRVLAYPLRRPGRFLAVSGLFAVILFGGAVAAAHFWVRHHREAARADLQRYHNMEAMTHLDVCLRFHERDSDTLLLAARAARRLDRLDQADHFLNRYEKLYGIDDDRFILERLLLRIERGQSDNLTPFIDARLKEHHPDSPLILEALASSFLRSFRLKDAQVTLDTWLALQPDNTQALLLQGHAFELRQKAEGALASYRRILELDPEMEAAHLKLTAALLRLGRAEQALPHLSYLHARHPDNPEVEVRLARCYLLLGQPTQRAEALRLLDGVLARQPDYPPALAERGKLARQAGDNAQALALLRRAVLLDPSDVPTHYQLYQCLTEAGKKAEAKEELARLEQLEADHRKMEKIIAVDMQQSPHDPKLHYEVAKIAFYAGLTRESVRWLQRALTEDPHFVPAHLTLADYYQQNGDSAQAAYHREQARLSAARAPAQWGEPPQR